EIAGRKLQVTNNLVDHNVVWVRRWASAVRVLIGSTAVVVVVEVRPVRHERAADTGRGSGVDPAATNVVAVTGHRKAVAVDVAAFENELVEMEVLDADASGPASTQDMGAVGRPAHGISQPEIDPAEYLDVRSRLEAANPRGRRLLDPRVVRNPRQVRGLKGRGQLVVNRAGQQGSIVGRSVGRRC